nr:nucleoside hydrolase [Actinomycetota bacterium]
MSKPVLMDADTAGDDVTSMLFALKWPGIDLLAVTVAAGNVYLDQAVENTLYTVEIAGRSEVPVYAGADRPLMRELVTAHYVHGEDGVGNSDFPPAKKQPEAEHAVEAIVDHANRYAGQLEVIAQAPLTNIALALARDPDLPSKIKRLWIMGGANNFMGNVTPAAEFNFYVDPEAAHIVINAGFNTTLVPWDVCLKDGILYGDELRPIEEMHTTLSEFYLSVNRAAREFIRLEYDVDGISHPDAIMTAMVIDEAMITERGNWHVDVEYRSDLTAGYSVVDTLGVMQKGRAGRRVPGEGREPNADVVVRADKERFKQMLARVLAS